MTYREADPPPRRIFLATLGHVVALDADSGLEQWRQELTGMAGSSIVLVHAGDWLFAAAYRAAARLSAVDGRVVWRTQHDDIPAPNSIAVELDIPRGRIVIAGSGVVAALAADNGDVVWKNDLKGLGYHPIAMRVPGAIGATTITYRSGKTTAVLLDEQDQSK